MSNTDFVQSLDENKRKRGRPESKLNRWTREQYKDLTSRQSINNKRHMLSAFNVALALGLVDGDFRDVVTGKRVQTKLAIIGRFLGDNIGTDAGREWLNDAWQFIVNVTTDELIAWTKGNQ
jgi:hypothetical protein